MISSEPGFATLKAEGETVLGSMLPKRSVGGGIFEGKGKVDHGPMNEKKTSLIIAPTH